MKSNPVFPAINENAVMIPSKRDKFLATYCKQQPWSFPDSIIYCMAKNPISAKCYQKLTNSCKYFFVENSLLVMSRLEWVYGRDKKWYSFADDETADFYKTSLQCWIVDAFDCNTCDSGECILNNYFTSKIYKCDVEKLYLYCIRLSYDDFIFLASKCNKISLCSVTIVNEYDCIVGLENIIETSYKLKEFMCEFNENLLNVVTPKTVQNLLKIPHFFELNAFTLTRIPETFDMESFYDHIKKNKVTKIHLKFSIPSSDAYKNRLQIIINEILATKNRNYKIPFIYFSGNEQSSYKKMFKLYHGYDGYGSYG